MKSRFRRNKPQNRAVAHEEGSKDKPGQSYADQEKQAEEMASKAVSGKGSQPQLAKEAPTDGPSVSPWLKGHLQKIAPNGKPLSDKEKQKMEPVSGENFDNVRVHDDLEAQMLSDSIGAKAFTSGQHIFYGSGASGINTSDGQKTMAHEMAHTQQQATTSLGKAVQLEDGEAEPAPASNFVFLASGNHLKPNDIAKVKKDVQYIFSLYKFQVEESQFVQGSENGMPYLGLRWNADWGGSAPSKWMDPDKLDNYLYYTFSQGSGELATTPYETEEYEKEFTVEEMTWIDEVLATPEINQMFRNIEDLPKVVLHRVTRMKKDARGKTRGKEVAISDSVYGPRDKGLTEGGEWVKLVDEQKFKATLIHELVHFIDNNSPKGNNDVLKLLKTMMFPDQNGFEPYAFGWFWHPKSKEPLHFDHRYINSLSAVYNISAYPDLVAAKQAKEYEKSPMITSGKKTSPEEDLATCIGWYLASGDTRRALEKKYPKRYEMVSNYYKLNLPQKEAERLAQK